MNKVDHYEFGLIIINGKEYSQDLIVSPSYLYPRWWRKEGHTLHLEDLDIVFKWNPSLLIIGTGANGCMKVPEELKNTLQKKKIEVFVANSYQACKQYNTLSQKRKDITLAIHLTC